MVDRVGVPLLVIRASVVIALVIALGGCGSGGGASAGGHDAAFADLTAPSTPASCARTVLATLGQVAQRIYHEGVASEPRRCEESHRPVSDRLGCRSMVDRLDG